jgi:uncharacterized protein YcfL
VSVLKKILPLVVVLLAMPCYAEIRLDPGVLITGLFFEDVSLHRKGNGLSLSTSVVGRHERDVILYYRIRWLDASGRDVSANEAWRSVSVGKGRSVPISAVTDSLSATDYRLQLNVIE